MKKELNLKNCPMCDSKATHIKVGYDDPKFKKIIHYIMCSNKKCGVLTPCYTYKGAVKIWNRRVG